MELICKIPDELYKKWEQSKFTLNEAYQFVDCVMKGTPLSEHGRTIDADALKQHIARVFPMVYGGVASEIDNAETIIPATAKTLFDKMEEEFGKDWDVPKQTATKEGVGE